MTKNDRVGFGAMMLLLYAASNADTGELKLTAFIFFCLYWVLWATVDWK